MKYTDKTFEKKFGHRYYENTSLISNSMISTFLKSPYRYKQMYIDKTATREPTDSMIVGGAVDCILTEGMKTFQGMYEVVKRRTCKKTQLTEVMFDSVMGLVARIEQQPVYQSIAKGCKTYKKSANQIILVDEELGVKGKLDFLQISKDKKRARIVDLKTTRSVQPHRYHYSCLDYGYYRQMAMYRYLVGITYPEVEEIACYHLAIEKDNDGIYPCMLYDLGTHRLNIELEGIQQYIQEIKSEKDFAQKTVDWDDTVLLWDVPEEDVNNFTEA